jgi:transcriptional regulator with XRE-family HTH domain
MARSGLRSPKTLVILKRERAAFAMKVRIARAILDWSQTDLAERVGMTQRAIHKIEQGDTEPRRTTVRAIEEVWREAGVEFEELADSGFRVTIRSSLLKRPATNQSRRQRAARMQLGVTAISGRSPAYRA